jgi:signal transduction histidine kinase
MLQSINSAWERRDQAFSDWVPYLTLALPTILSQLQPRQSWSERAWTVGVVALAAAWVYVMYTRSPLPRREHRVRMAIYFTGLLVLASVLMSRQLIFFVFAIAGFFHASLLRPWPLMVLGVGATSTVIQTLTTGFPWPTVDLWVLYLTVIFVQTVAIGFGSVLGEKLSGLSRQRKEAVARLEAALEENAGLHAQLLAQAREAGVLDERHRMAREIHDTLAQGLTGIITQLEAAQVSGRPEDRQRHLDNAARLARESLSEARRSVQAWRPEPLDGAELPGALAEVARQWSALNGVPVEVVTTGDPMPLHPEIEAALLRTAQEALANVAKHARASRAGLTLSYMGDVVTLDVRDDGVGFEVLNGSNGPNGTDGAGTGRDGSGFGLAAMRQRVSRVAGTLAVESEPGGGTAISARVPAIGAQFAGDRAAPPVTPKEARES